MFLDPGNSRNGSLSLSRRMQRLRGNDGLIVGVAIDHRESLRAAFARSEIPDPSKASIAAFKAAVIETLAGMASVVLLDRLYGSAALTHLPARVALAMPLEADGYESVGDVRLTRMDPGFSPIKASRYGADATKLLVPYRPDIQETARHQEGIVRGAIERSHRYGLPVIVEPVVYQLQRESAEEYARDLPGLVIKTARRMSALNPDLLKLQFPAVAHSGRREGRAACQEITESVGGIPWVLLGGLADEDGLVEQVSLAVQAGAGGFIAGRGVWALAITRDLNRTREILVRDSGRVVARCHAAAREAIGERREHLATRRAGQG